MRFKVLSRKKIVVITGTLVVSLVVSIVGVNLYVTISTNNYIVTSNEKILKTVKPDCILILGASVRADGSPSHMLRKRLEKGLELYKSGAAPKILVSGDNSTVHYNETHVMRIWLENRGVPSRDIFEDHAGFSTYESMYRAHKVFNVESALVVTQRYHLARSVYNSRALGIRTWGVSAGGNNYSGQFKRDVREWLARVKDFGQTIIKSKPTYLGPKGPINGDGNTTR